MLEEVQNAATVEATAKEGTINVCKLQPMLNKRAS